MTSEYKERQMDIIANILKAQKVVRDDGSVFYQIVLPEERKLIVTKRIEKLFQYIENENQVAYTNGFNSEEKL